MQPVRTIYGGKRSGTTFAVMQDGTVRAWGANSTGNLGDGTYTNAAVPRVVAGLTNPRQISAGRDYTCATTFNEGLSCWGRDIRQLIDTSLAVGPTPRANPDLEPDTVIAGDTSVCGRFNGYVQCWGFFLGPVPVPQAPSDPVMSFDTVDNFSSVSVLHVSAFGRLSRQNVTQYSDLSTRLRDRIVAVTAGANSYCAVTGAGTVVCAGSGADGHLGNGSLNNVLDESPTDTGLTQVTSVVAGDGGHYCALRTDRTVWCWGANIAGQTGAGIDGDAVLRPTQVPITDVVQITSGMYHSCALRGDGTVWCWGLDNDGQLGDGDALSAPRFTPVRVLF